MSETIKKGWFKWSNGQLQQVFVYKQFILDHETAYRGKSGKRSFVLKARDYGKTWALTKEELL